MECSSSLNANHNKLVSGILDVNCNIEASLKLIITASL
jgi:hypothetical protein